MSEISELSETEAHAHTHTHDPQEVKAIVNRLAKAIGHLEAVKGMVENGRDCSEVLVQLAAVKAAVHISHCIVHAVEQGDGKAIEDLNRAIDQFLK